MKVNYQKIYEQLGYLFYSIAMADKEINAHEIKKLNELVIRDWVPLENSTDEYGTDAANYITASFDFLVDGFTTAEQAFDKFAAYYEQHEGAFDAPLKNQIFSTSREIANSFRGINRAEHAYLDKLSALLGVSG